MKKFFLPFLLVSFLSFVFSGCDLLFGDSQIDNSGELGNFFSGSQLVRSAKLRKDIRTICVFSVKEDLDLVLDLNGHTLTSTSPFHNNAVIFVNGIFHLIDSSSTGGSVKNEGKSLTIIEVQNEGTLYIQQSVYDSIGSENIIIGDRAKLIIQ